MRQVGRAYAFTDACLIVRAACGFETIDSCHIPFPSRSAVYCTTALSSHDVYGISSERELAADDPNTERKGKLLVL